MAWGPSTRAVISTQLSIVSHSALIPSFPTLKALVKIGHCKELPRDVLGTEWKKWGQCSGWTKEEKEDAGHWG